MDKTLFSKTGEPVAYIAEEYRQVIYLWGGSPVAYLHDEKYIYGINGRHLGWFVNSILYNHHGERIGFTSDTCPVTIAKEPTKAKKQSMDEIRPKWSAQVFPHLSFNSADQSFAGFLKKGQVVFNRKEIQSQQS